MIRTSEELGIANRDVAWQDLAWVTSKAVSLSDAAIPLTEEREFASVHASLGLWLLGNQCDRLRSTIGPGPCGEAVRSDD